MQYRATKNAYFYSYFPRTIREWNALPATIVEADSLARFQSGLRDYLDSDYKVYAACLLIYFYLVSRPPLVINLAFLF